MIPAVGIFRTGVTVATAVFSLKMSLGTLVTRRLTGQILEGSRRAVYTLGLPKVILKCSFGAILTPTLSCHILVLSFRALAALGLSAHVLECSW